MPQAINPSFGETVLAPREVRALVAKKGGNAVVAVHRFPGDSEDEIDGLYTALGDGGGALMPLGEHGIGRKFGWVSDRFGVSWQLSLP